MSGKPKHHYLEFTRKDRRGTLLLLGIIGLMISVPFIYPLFQKTSAKPPADIDAALASLQTKKTVADHPSSTFQDRYEKSPSGQRRPSSNASSAKIPGALFSFDPNTITAEGWKKLGLRDKTIATILNYREKGGRFTQATDIKKIWGLFPDEVERLMPYVNIVASESNHPSSLKNFSHDFSKPLKYDSRRNYEPVDINNSDTLAWMALPGIGPKLSQRIVNFRDKLGGFYSIEQVGETFGLPDSTFQKIKPLLQLSGDLKKIQINKASIDELKSHPYIRYQLGNALFQYRVQHGDFKNIADIKKIMIVDEAIYNKISPYISIE
ncbi:MAG: helix-hairpin-helix domain-containing protein [Chitinophagaceae bacterium]|nr:MAG: helix-hairpin-helix domain-containing protein [Chitinophagaceae bacterium]